MDFTRRTCSEEGEDCPIDRKGDGNRFLEFTSYDLLPLPGEWQNGHRLYYAELLSDSKLNCRKTAPFGEEKIAFPQCQRNGSHFLCNHGKLVKLHYEMLPHPPYLAQCDFFFTRLEKVTGRAEI